MQTPTNHRVSQAMAPSPTQAPGSLPGPMQALCTFVWIVVGFPFGPPDSHPCTAYKNKVPFLWVPSPVQFGHGMPPYIVSCPFGFPVLCAARNSIPVWFRLLERLPFGSGFGGVGVEVWGWQE